MSNWQPNEIDNLGKFLDLLNIKYRFNVTIFIHPNNFKQASETARWHGLCLEVTDTENHYRVVPDDATIPLPDFSELELSEVEFHD